MESVINCYDSESSKAQLVLPRTYGKLQFPSTDLWMLLLKVERCVERHTTDSLSAYLYQNIIDDVMQQQAAEAGK